MAFHRIKKNKLWVIKALERSTRRTVAWVLGNRDSATFRKLYDKVKHLKNCVFYTNKWIAFAEVLPPKRHIIGKKHTISIESDNSNTRHHLGRFTRCTKVVSQSEYMVDLILINTLDNLANLGTVFYGMWLRNAYTVPRFFATGISSVFGGGHAVAVLRPVAAGGITITVEADGLEKQLVRIISE